MSHHEAYEGSFNGEQAIWLRSASYEAAVLPQFGANLIALRETKRGYTILREPTADEMNEFKENPGVYGIPVLFPPNRYEDGKFPWQDQVYQLPINEPETNNHLHGFLHITPWQVESFSADESGARVTLRLTVGEAHDIYKQLPHAFTMRLTYTLNEHGLHQHAFIHNDGEQSMPCLLAFHTALNAPFAPDSAEQDITCFVTIGDRLELDERMLPTGQLQPLNDNEQKIKSTGGLPFLEMMDNHYSATPQNGRNYVELADRKSRQTVIYDVGTSYKYWMIWNKDAKSGFICCEPHINMVNAPNIVDRKPELTAEAIGLVSLAPGDIWEETSRIYVKGPASS